MNAARGCADLYANGALDRIRTCVVRNRNPAPLHSSHESDRRIDAWTGIEPAHDGFADRRVPISPPRVDWLPDERARRRGVSRRSLLVLVLHLGDEADDRLRG